jgi:2-dehydropantoate 2-reductase
MKIVVVGAGGIGGLAGTWMARAGVDVTFVDQYAEHVEAINRDGMRVDGVRGEHRVKVKAVTPSELEQLAPLETVIVAVKSHDTRRALEQLLPFSGADTAFVSLQAGENIFLFEEIVGASRTIGADPNYGAALVAPGHLEAGFPNYIWLGELDGQLTPRLRALQQALIHWTPTLITQNIVGTVWTKFVYGSQIVCTAITDRRSGEALDHPLRRRVAGALVRESIGIAQARGVELVGFDFFDPEPYTHSEEAMFFWMDHAWPRHEVFRAHSFHRFVKTGSGMRWDLMYRKRKTETAAMMHALIRFADEVGMPVPCNRALLQVIEEIEDGRRTLSDQNFVDLKHMIEASGGSVDASFTA